jgi:hypothetical protein
MHEDTLLIWVHFLLLTSLDPFHVGLTTVNTPIESVTHDPVYSVHVYRQHPSTWHGVVRLFDISHLLSRLANLAHLLLAVLLAFLISSGKRWSRRWSLPIS